MFSPLKMHSSLSVSASTPVYSCSQCLPQAPITTFSQFIIYFLISPTYEIHFLLVLCPFEDLKVGSASLSDITQYLYFFVAMVTI
jgi:hypothetical protein